MPWELGLVWWPCASERTTPQPSVQSSLVNGSRQAYQRRDTSRGGEAPSIRQRKSSASVPNQQRILFETLSRYFFPGTCFAAAACFFFWAAALALTCFCDACLCTDFGDLSPIITLPFIDGLHPAVRSRVPPYC